MNRAFKIEFHNGFPDEKPIVTMSLKVNHGGRFNKLDEDGRDALSHQLAAFIKSLETFRKEVERADYQTNNQ
jgi:hypothetical protein